jgi:hypothetical protein
MTKQAKILTDADQRACLDPICARPLLLQRIAHLEDALRLVLPMAKGWAHEHPVGDNQGKVDEAAAVLGQDADSGGEIYYTDETLKL